MGKEQKMLKRVARQNWVEHRVSDFPKWESIMAKLDNKLRKESAAMKRSKRGEESK